jgi:hypothetical protein
MSPDTKVGRDARALPVDGTRATRVHPKGSHDRHPIQTCSWRHGLEHVQQQARAHCLAVHAPLIKLPGCTISLRPNDHGPVVRDVIKPANLPYPLIQCSSMLRR